MFQIKLNVLVISALILMGIGLQAQGTMRGRISSGTDGEMLTGAVARIMNGDQVAGGAYSDLEGAYTLKAAPGTYTMIVSYLGYISDSTQITLESGKVTVRDIILYEEAPSLEDVVEITAKANKASSATFMKKKMNALSSIDGITNDVLQRTGDNNVAAALQRVSGVTIEGGKYVYVRGLGDRYSKTLLNGATIPSLDPDRNSVQLDLFPSNLIDNIVVHKTFTPDLPGDFTGGLVDVITRDFPDKFKMKVGYSAGYNTQASFNDNFLSYNTGSTDWLGYDDGTRATPASVSNVIGVSRGDYTSYINNDDLAEEFETRTAQVEPIAQTTRDFANNGNLVPERVRSGFDQNLQFSIGNQYTLFGRPFGFIAGFTYNSQWDHFGDGRYGRFQNTSSVGNVEPVLKSLTDLGYAQSERKVVWGALTKFSYKVTPNHSISVNLMRNQGGNSTSADFAGSFLQDPNDTLVTSALVYTERMMNTIQVNGDHLFGKIKADWTYSSTRSSQENPNTRFFASQFTPGPDTAEVYTRAWSINPPNYQDLGHYYRDLKQNTRDARLNIEFPLNMSEDLKGMIKVGGAYTYSDRTFSEDRFIYNGIPQTFDGRPIDSFRDLIGYNFAFDSVFNEPTYTYQLLIEDRSEAANQYVANQTIWAGYVMAEVPVSERLKFVGGVRIETTDILTQSEDPDSSKIGEISTVDPLPMMSAIWSINAKQNLRAVYARTIARPTFREIAPFESFRFAADLTLLGNPDLDRTLIDNFDLRWEYFPTGPEIISASLFYKKFQNPIEQVIRATAQNPEITWQNVDQATIFGAEFEVKKNLAFLGGFFKNFQLGGNLSLINSRVDIDTASLSKIRSIDPTRPARRQLYGQSPWAANGNLSYISLESGLEATLSYVNFGPRIKAIALNAPDVYEQSRGLLNLSISKRLGDFKIRARFNNILNPEYLQTMTYAPAIDGVEAQTYIYESYRVGRSISLGLSYSL